MLFFTFPFQSCAFAGLHVKKRISLVFFCFHPTDKSENFCWLNMNAGILIHSKNSDDIVEVVYCMLQLYAKC